MNKKTKLIILAILLSACVFEYNVMSRQDGEFKANYRGVSCYGRDIIFERTACCHGQCENVSEWPDSENAPEQCKKLWPVAFAK